MIKNNNKGIWTSCSLLVGLALILSVPTAIAATPPTLPSPGAVTGTLPQTPALKAPPTELPIELEPITSKKSKSRSSQSIKVLSFDIRGNTVISSDELQAQISRWLDQSLTLDDLDAVSTTLTAYYHQKGYQLARVYVPAQRIVKGIVKLNVIEGKLSGFAFEGNTHYSNELLENYLGSLETGEVISLDSLERELLLLNDLPGHRARAVVRPGPVYGTSELLIRSQEQPVTGSLAINNYGNEDIGTWRIDGSMDVNNPLGIADQLSLAAIHAQENLLNYGSLAYSFPLNSEGTRATASAEYLKYEVSGFFSPLNLEGENLYSHILITHPLQRSRRQNVLLGIGLGHNIAESRTLSVTTSDENITLLDVNLFAQRTHNDESVSTGSAILSSNFESNANATRQDAQRGKLELELSHERPVIPNWSLLSRVIGVASIDPLADSEKFYIGGPESVRGFPSSEIFGDQGAQLSMQLQRQLQMTADVPAIFRVYWDGAKVYNKQPQFGELEDASLTSVGLGVSALIKKIISLDVDYVRPTNSRTVSDGKNNDRLWLNLTAYF